MNDISILWPVPQSAEDASKLIAVNEKLADGTTSIWPEGVFKKVIATAQTVTVQGSGTGIGQIQFGGDRAAFENLANWKIAGIRIDPSAPGCGEKIIRTFGSTPQIRLIVQPVTLQGQKARVHDMTAHLVFDFVTGTEPPVAPGLRRRAVPDRERFKSVLEDLAALKAALLAVGVQTDGELGVHPAFNANAADFSEKVKSLLKKHLSGTA